MTGLPAPGAQRSRSVRQINAFGPHGSLNAVAKTGPATHSVPMPYRERSKEHSLETQWVLASKSLAFQFNEQQHDTLQQMKGEGFTMDVECQSLKQGNDGGAVAWGQFLHRS